MKKTHEAIQVSWVFQNPNGTYEEMKREIGSDIARKEVFDIAKHRLKLCEEALKKYHRTPHIIKKLTNIFKQRNHWENYEEFLCEVSNNNINPICHAKTIERVWARLSTTTHIIDCHFRSYFGLPFDII